MAGAIITAAVSLLVFLGGQLFQMRNERKRDAQAAEREEARYQRDRQDRFEEFQRANLLALQDALQTYMLDSVNHRPNAIGILTDPLGFLDDAERTLETVMASFFDTIRLVTRIENDALRERANEFVGLVSLATGPDLTPEASPHMPLKLQKEQVDPTRALGEAVRSL